MASHSLLLKLKRNPPIIGKTWKQRRYRRELIYFFESVSLYLKAGYALSYAWAETLTALKESLNEELYRELKSGENQLLTEALPSQLMENESMGSLLDTLSQKAYLPSSRIWFGVLKQLYASGAGLTQAVEAFSRTLRREQEREWEAHSRQLPVKTNVVLMIFFLPPTFLILFVPLILEFTRSLK